MPKTKLGLKALKELSAVDKPTIWYDCDLTGFGLKLQPSGARSWIIEYRPGAGGRGVTPRRMVIGTPKTLTPEQARQRAAKLLAEAKTGGDPAASRQEEREAGTVTKLIKAYTDEVRAKSKASTAALYDIYKNNHIEPAIGSKKAPRHAHSRGLVLQ